MADSVDPTDPLEREPLLFLVGATATGKSALAIELALALGREIASLDSMLVYRGLDIGTAKPSAEQCARVPHHLIDLVEPNESYSVSRYVADASALVGRLAATDSRGAPGAGARRVIFVGGTALYLKALTHGLFRGPEVDPTLRAELEARFDELGPEAFFAELSRVDPASAARLHPNDKKRVVRALEVHAQSGRPLSAWQREWEHAGGRAAGRARRIVAIDVAVEELDRRIARRTTELLDAGWVEEARRVRETTGFGRTAVAALGYADVLELADGRIDRATCEARINLRTRQFARRQRTWLRQFPEIRWLSADFERARDEALDFLRADRARP